MTVDENEKSGQKSESSRQSEYSRKSEISQRSESSRKGESSEKSENGQRSESGRKKENSQKSESSRKIEISQKSENGQRSESSWKGESNEKGENGQRSESGRKKENSRKSEGQEGRLSFGRIRKVARIEYVKWLMNPRMVMMMILYAFIYDYVIEEFVAGAEKMGSFLMILEPFVAITNSELLVMVIPVVFLVLISDFPKTDGNTMFYIQRVGKDNWMLGQILFGTMAAITYLFSIIFMSFVMIAHKGFCKNMWSTVVTQYVKNFPNETKSKIPRLINSRLYNNMTPIQAFVLTVTFMFLYLVVIELLMLIGFSTGKRIVGIIIGYTIIAVGSSLVFLGTKMKWIFPTSHAIAWLHFDSVLRRQKFGIKYSYLYFVGVIVVMIMVSMICVKQYDFSKVTDMEG